MEKSNSSNEKNKTFNYDKELKKLHEELVHLQEWVKNQGLKVVIIFEGRDASGKGGTIKRFTEPLNPRICKVVALGVPTEREKTQWYFQRYVQSLIDPRNFSTLANVKFVILCLLTLALCKAVFQSVAVLYKHERNPG